MKIEAKQVTIGELIVGYINNGYDGVEAFDGKLDVRPPYQREYVYKEEQRNAVIDSVMRGLPLNIMYWSDKEDGTYEIIDGQQRTISICEFGSGVFSIPIDGKLLGFYNLSDETREKFLNYELLVYVCEGTDDQKLDWFHTINIAGEKLLDQEIRNAVYHGEWLSDAKVWFSRTNCPAVNIGGNYINGQVNRQDFLETAIKWISRSQNIEIEEYMRIHQHDSNAEELWIYYSNVINWIKSIFKKTRADMKSIRWGDLYIKYRSKEYDSEYISGRVEELYKDIELDSKKGIYEYLLSGNSKYLNLRTFPEEIKVSIYEQQDGKCKFCNIKFPISKMHADHIKPWSLGGKTEPDNCQVLCQSCNATKSGNY